MLCKTHEHFIWIVINSPKTTIGLDIISRYSDHVWQARIDVVDGCEDATTKDHGEDPIGDTHAITDGC